MNKRANGIYYTAGNPFDNIAFKDWAYLSEIKNANILEPFAGENSLILTLQEMGFCKKFCSYDIFPQNHSVKKRDTFKSFPKKYHVCITNPPWLAKNSATVRNLPFPETHHDDLYKFALEKCLDNCDWVAALIPESFIKAGLFHDRLLHFVSLSSKMFLDTGHPVGLALFAPHHSKDIMVWRDNDLVGQLSMLKNNMPKSDHIKVKFNDPNGNVGLIALDNTIKQSIRFCDVKELEGYQVKTTGRHITKLTVEGNVLIKNWNDCLASFRAITKDVLMTCYKGIRKDGCYRRRLDWETARSIVNYAS